MADEFAHLPMTGSVTGDEQRNLQRRFLSEKTVSRFAVIAQRLTMIGCDDDQRVRVGSHDRTDGPGECVIDVRDLAEVFVIAERRQKRLRRRVRGMRVVEMDPEEALL